MKKLLIALVACNCVPAFASVGDGANLDYSLSGVYKKFQNELKIMKLPNMVTTSITFSNEANNFINANQTNIDSIDATIATNDKNWQTYNFEYSYAKDDLTKEKVLLSYIRTQQMPIGGYINSEDIDSSAINQSLQKVRDLSPKYTSNKLYSISIGKKLDASGGVTMYTYKFNKNNICYDVTYSYNQDKIINIAETSCPSE